MAGTMRVRRSRGAFSGFLLVLLGVWGGLIPLVGPYVHYAYTPDSTWTLTTGRVWLELLPAGATVIGGLLVMISKVRPLAMLGATIAILSGAWFAIGRTLMPLWTSTGQGAPVGGQLARALEQIGFFAGLGAVIICVAAVALGGLSVVSVRDSIAATSMAAPAGAYTSSGASARSSRLPRVWPRGAGSSSGATTGSQPAAGSEADTEDKPATEGTRTGIFSRKVGAGSSSSS